MNIHIIIKTILFIIGTILLVGCLATEQPKFLSSNIVPIKSTNYHFDVNLNKAMCEDISLPKPDWVGNVDIVINANTLVIKKFGRITQIKLADIDMQSEIDSEIDYVNLVSMRDYTSSLALGKLVGVKEEKIFNDYVLAQVVLPDCRSLNKIINKALIQEEQKNKEYQEKIQQIRIQARAIAEMEAQNREIAINSQSKLNNTSTSNHENQQRNRKTTLNSQSKSQTIEEIYDKNLINPEITIKNQTDRIMSLLLSGPEKINIKIKPSEEEKITIKDGVYYFEATAEKAYPTTGVKTFYSNYRYVWYWVMQNQ